MKQFSDRLAVSMLQMALSAMGHSVGAVDGVIGNKTRAALRKLLGDSLPSAKPKSQPDPRLKWPLESELDAFYGPRGDHSQMSLLKLPRPLRLYSPEGPVVDAIYAHNKIHEPLYRCLDKVGSLPDDVIKRHELQVTAGVYNDRLKVGGNGPSTHSWACAIDISPRLNAYGKNPDLPQSVVDIFEAEGAEWGGNWSTPDGMHMQFCRSK